MNSTYKFVNVDPCFAFEPSGFLECRTLNCRIGWALFNMPLAINTIYLFSILSHIEIPKVANYKYHKVVVACVHPLHYWAQHQE